MKIETQNLENHETKIIVEVSNEEFEPLKIQAARKIAGQAKIAGFRPGKAPYEIIRRNYGDTAIAQEAMDIFLEKQYEQILKESAIDPGGMGRLDKVDQIDPPKFSIIVPLASTVDLGSYREIREVFEEPVLTDEDIKGTLDELKRPYAVAEPADGPATDGQSVYVLIKAEIEDPDGENGTKELIKEMPYEFIIGQDTEKESAWPYVNFTQTLIGAEPGQVITSDYLFPEETPVESMRGKKAVFTTTIQSIKKLVMPAGDLEFAKNYGEYDTYETFFEDMKTRILDRKKHLYEEDFIEKVLAKMIGNAEFKYSPDALETEVQEMVEDFKHRLSHQNLDIDTYLKLQKTDMDKFLNEEIKPNAENQLKRKLALQEFASKEKIHIDFEKFKETVTSLEGTVTKQYQEARTKKQKDEIMNRITTSAMNQTFTDSLFARLQSIAKGENPAIESDKPEEPVDENALVKSEEVITPLDFGKEADSKVE
ncbi:MAG: trigger factor [Flexilinea sp.]